MTVAGKQQLDEHHIVRTGMQHHRNKQLCKHYTPLGSFLFHGSPPKVTLCSPLIRSIPLHVSLSQLSSVARPEFSCEVNHD